MQLNILKNKKEEIIFISNAIKEEVGIRENANLIKKIKKAI